MHRVSKLLLLIGALCFLAAGVSIGFTLAAPQGASAAQAMSIGTSTLPPQPTEEPTASPVPPTAMAVQPTPTNTPRPTHRPKHDPTPTAISSPTPEPWLTDVEIVKRADKTHVLPGDTLMYTLVARNIGAKAAFDVVVSDHVPQQLEVVDLASSKGDIAVEGQTVTAYPRTLEAGESAEYRITVCVRASAALGQIANTGRITTSTTGDTPDNNTSTVTVEIRTPERQIQTVQEPPRLPHTAETPDVPVIAVLASISPITWVGMFGGLLMMLGGVISWGLRGWLRRVPAKAGSGAVQMDLDESVSQVFRVPAAGPVGPPRLGSELPAAAPPAPLPPLVQLDRDDALRDAVRGDLED
jgi:uncharacterized repeat protein (TIGR01451 family)